MTEFALKTMFGWRGCYGWVSPSTIQLPWELQAMLPDGAPVADALVQTPHGVAQTDEKGYFQIDVARGDPIKVARNDGATCQMKLPELVVKNDFASVGKVVCR